MFVREKKNKSGSISVQIIDKEKGYKLIETVGCSKDKEEIEKLKKKATSLIETSFNKQLSLFGNDDDKISVNTISL